MKNNYEQMTASEAAKFAFGANVFPKEFINIWEVKSASKQLSKAEETKKQWQVEGFTVIKKSYSDFVALSAARKRNNPLN